MVHCFRRPRLAPRVIFMLCATISLLLLPEARAGEIRLKLEDAPPRGTLVALVYRDADSFGDFRQAYRRVDFANQTDDYRITDLPDGDYAVLLFWDENGNGRLDRNFIGIPREPVALTNNYRPKGPPSFRRASVTVEGDQSVSQTLTLDRPLGELGQIGIGVGAVGQTSPYRGSNARPVQAIPALIYIGDRLQWTGPLVRYTLTGGDDWRLALQGSLRLGAYEESDSAYLTGMGDRKTTFMGGIAVLRELPAGFSLSASAQTDLFERSGGQIASLDLSRGFQWGLWRFSPSVGLNWLSADLANYEFGVAEARAHAERPAYSLSSALNWEVGMTAFYEISPSWQLVASLGLETLDSDIVDSPIVDKDRLGKGFVSLTYSF